MELFASNGPGLPFGWTFGGGEARKVEGIEEEEVARETRSSGRGCPGQRTSRCPMSLMFR